MGEIIIRLPGFNKHVIERIIYIIIILVLATLLVFSYLNDDSETVVQEENNEQNTQPENNEEDTQLTEKNEEENTSESVIDATCSDGTQNQDETAVDCGGVCAAINGEYFYDGECHFAPEETQDTESSELSGRVLFSVSDIKKQTADSGAIKVISYKATVENGLDRNVFASVVAYAESTTGIALNQFTQDLKPYIPEVSLGKIEPGEKKTITVEEAGPFIFEQSGYTLGNEFSLLVELLDDGSKIDEVEKTVRG